MTRKEPGSMIPELDDDNTINSLDRALRIVDYIRRHDGAGVSELAAEFETSKSTTHRHLKTLKEHGYLVQDGSTYHIGLRFLDPGVHAKYRQDAFSILEPRIEELAAETDERAQFIAEENGLGIHVHSVVGERGIETESRVGKMVYLHATAAGKCILAHLPEERVDEIVDRHGLPELTDRTITDRDELDAELARVREQGYALNRAERRPRMQAVGVPILGPDSDVIGGISVTGPVRRMQGKDQEDLPDKLLDVADEIMLRLEYA